MLTMTTPKLFNLISLIIVDKLGVDSRYIYLNSVLEKDLGVDELDIVEIVMDLERELSITIDDVYVDDFVTIKDIIDYLQSKHFPEKDLTELQSTVIKIREEIKENEKVQSDSFMWFH